MKKVIFIIGAGRSGTKLLADTLADNIDACYLNEINDFWKQVSPFLKTDFIPEKYAKTKKAIRLKEKLYKKCDEEVIIEKTAANSIRIPFLKGLFPDALFIHILRDGREVAISARKKYYGDIRKVTQDSEDNISTQTRIKHLKNQVFNKFKYAFNPLYYLSNFRRFTYMILKELKLKKYTPWGIHYPGYSYLFKHLSPLEIAADQWQYSVLQIKNYFSEGVDKNYYELKYEDLVSNTDKEIKNLIEFLKIENPKLLKNNIDTKIYNEQYQNLEDGEKIILNRRLKFTLSSLGYKN